MKNNLFILLFLILCSTIAAQDVVKVSSSEIPLQLNNSNTGNQLHSDFKDKEFYHSIEEANLQITEYYKDNYNEQINYYLEMLNKTDILFPLMDKSYSVFMSFLNNNQNNKYDIKHLGIDYKIQRGVIIYAPVTGTIIQKGYEPLAFGNYVILMSEKGVYFHFGHMNKVDVIVGQRIEQGTRIGRVGNTGLSFEQSLHFCISVDGYYINPEIVKFREDFKYSD